MARVEWLKARLDEGYRISEAARLIGGDRAAVPANAADLVEELVGATVATDLERIVRALDQTFSLLPADRAITEVAEPALKRVGDLWKEGEARIADEHYLTELTRARLRSLVDGGLPATRGLAVLCCVPDERHECGLVALAVLMHADGWGIVYLGADTPLAEAAALAAERGARLLCVSATMAAHARAAEPELRRLARRYQRMSFVRGGAAFGGEPAARAVVRLRALAK